MMKVISKMHSRQFLSFLLAVTIFSITVGNTYALSNTLPDNSDQSSGAAVMLVSANSSFVKSYTNSLKIWFPTNSGSVTIYNGNFCNSNAFDYIQNGDNSWSGIGNGTRVTHFVAQGQEQYGFKYASGSANCAGAKTFNFSNLPQQPGLSSFYADFSATAVGPVGVMNYYRLVASAGAEIGQSGNTSGRGITMEQVDSNPRFINYYASFGTPCLPPADLRAKISLYDIDNAGGGGAQPAGSPVTVRVLDKTTGGYVNFIGPTGSTWTPQGDNRVDFREFNSLPGHKYKLEINNVYWNNTIQYSVPYDQAYIHTCLPPPTPVQPTFTPIVDDIFNYEKSPTDVSVEHYVKIKPGCNTSPTSSFVWNTSGNGGPNLGNTQVTVDNNCSGEYNTSKSKAIISREILNSMSPGSIYSRSTTVLGQPSETKSGKIYEVPYARFYGQDIYATGEGATPNGTIFFNTNTAGSAGSASQYAAIAKNLISGAANGIKINTAAFRGSSPSPNDGLKAQWTSAPNASDIYTKVKNNLKINSTPGSQTNVITSIPVGGVTIAKDDNIYIDKNITEGTQDKIALFVAGRDIYIAPDVTRIDAVLIAKGTVYTCATSDSLPSRGNWQNLPTDTPAGCRNTLTINGAVSAKNIKFQRSVGTRLMAGVDEDSGSAGKVNIESRGGGNNSTAAEVINYPAYLNFSSLNLKDTSTNSVNAIFNAPPLL